MAASPVNFCSLALFFLALCCYLMVAPTVAGSSQDGQKSDLKDGSSSGNYGSGMAGNAFGNRRGLRSLYGFGPKMLQISRSKIPIELDLLVENEDSDRSKRFDDYGHMRFGKRGGEEQFDDYGHMRFGRSA